ncbi:MAG: LysO family transporter, partial [Pseudothermotoga sp.]
MSAVVLLSSVVVGLITGRMAKFQLPGNAIALILYILVLLVGLDLSKEKIEKRLFKDISLVILSTVGGTFLFTFLLSFFLP